MSERLNKTVKLMKENVGTIVEIPFSYLKPATLTRYNATGEGFHIVTKGGDKRDSRKTYYAKMLRGNAPRYGKPVNVRRDMLSPYDYPEPELVEDF